MLDAHKLHHFTAGFATLEAEREEKVSTRILRNPKIEFLQPWMPMESRPWAEHGNGFANAKHEFSMKGKSNDESNSAR